MFNRITFQSSRIWLGLNSIVGQFNVYGIITISGFIWIDSEFTIFHNTFRLLQLSSIVLLLINFKWYPILKEKIIKGMNPKLIFKIHCKESIILSVISLTGYFAGVYLNIFSQIFNQKLFTDYLLILITIYCVNIALGSIGPIMNITGREKITSLISMITIALYCSLIYLFDSAEMYLLFIASLLVFGKLIMTKILFASE